jgi:protein-S-isoprenylcysteine O-methyltransferase Ste14
MSVVPAFELGLLNAWIFMILDALVTPVFLRIIKERKQPDTEKAVSGMSSKAILTYYFSKVMVIPALIYSFFLPLKTGTVWFYTGLPITLIGLIISFLVLIQWSNSPPDKPITNGLYRFSRHPMYVAAFLIYIGVGIACASWIFILLALLNAGGSLAFIKAEEQMTIELYGEVYREYVDRTPRCIGLPKSKKS